MKKFALVFAVLALASPAFAADLPARRQALIPSSPPPPVFDWSGIYIGANGGAGFGDAAWSFPTADPSFAHAGDGFGTHPNGALAGGQIGFNRQFGPWLFGLPWLFGVEFTGDWTGLRQTLAGPTPDFPLNSWTTTLTDVETITARFGVPLNNWLFYGKAGGATGAISLHALSATASYDQTSRALGETFGGGIEYALAPNLFLGVEYDFIRLYPGTFIGTESNGKAISVAAGSPFDVQSILARLSYRFYPVR